MKKTVIIFLMFMIIQSCANQIVKNDNLEIYKNQVYLKVKTSSGDSLLVSHVYSDDFGINGIRLMKKVIDIKTFKKDSVDNYFIDKNNRYYLQIKYDAATLSIVK